MPHDQGDIDYMNEITAPRAWNTVKETNPKDAVGVRKVPLHVVPERVTAEVGLALLEGARKYGSYNWRAAGVRASVYYDATRRHLGDWWEGVDIDPDSGLSHVTKAIASLTVLRDSMMHGNWQDDRPIRAAAGWVQDMNGKAAEIIDRYPDAKAPFTHTRGELEAKHPLVAVEPSPLPIVPLSPEEEEGLVPVYPSELPAFEQRAPVKKKKLYLAGPMRNIKDFNFPAFMQAAADLRDQGYFVFNPAEADIERNGPDTNKSETGDLTEAAAKGFSLREALAADMKFIAEEADAIALLPGYSRSPGARAEKALAEALGLEVIKLSKTGNYEYPKFIK